MFEYDFLILSLLFLLPGSIIYALRKDLRPVIRVMMICSIPFAFTEFLFYPDYWEPVFLFDLASRIGFGIEDLIFVCGLGAFTSTGFLFFSGLRLENREEKNTPGKASRRLALLFSVTFLLVFIAAALGVPMIYGSFFIMIGVSSVVFLIRRDLFLPSLAGAGIAVIVYTALSLAFALLFPHAFRNVWHTEKFLNLFFLGIPLEEYMYGFACGMAATMFYPYVFNRFFCRKEQT
jgi:hypothetical protein